MAGGVKGVTLRPGQLEFDVWYLHKINLIHENALLTPLTKTLTKPGVAPISLILFCLHKHVRAHVYLSTAESMFGCRHKYKNIYLLSFKELSFHKTRGHNSYWKIQSEHIIMRQCWFLSCIQSLCVQYYSDGQKKGRWQIFDLEIRPFLNCTLCHPTKSKCVKQHMRLITREWRLRL